MRCHLKGLLPASPFLDYVFSSELKNSKTFFTLSFGQQMKDIVLQTNFFNFSLHLRRNIFGLIFVNAGVWTFHMDLFLQMEKILHQNTPKNLKPYFDFVFCVYIIWFCENLKISKIAKFHTRENILT